MKILTLLFVCLSFGFQSFAGDTSYFSGNEIMYSPDGKIVYGNNPKLLKREVDKKNGEIREEAVIIVFGEGKVQNLVLSVSDNSFSTQTAEYSGSGQFFGIPWQWTAWKTDFVTAKGEKLKVVDYLSDGTIKSTAEFYGVDGSLVSVQVANLHSISESTYMQLKATMLTSEK